MLSTSGHLTLYLWFLFWSTQTYIISESYHYNGANFILAIVSIWLFSNEDFSLLHKYRVINIKINGIWSNGCILRALHYDVLLVDVRCNLEGEISLRSITKHHWTPCSNFRKALFSNCLLHWRNYLYLQWEADKSKELSDGENWEKFSCCGVKNTTWSCPK